MDPIVIVFEPSQLEVVGLALGEVPFKLAKPVIDSINKQIEEARAYKAKQAADAAKPVVEAEPA